jgi:hypothetical protein
LLAELQFGVRDAEARAAFGVEEVFEIDVLVGQLVAFQPDTGYLPVLAAQKADAEQLARDACAAGVLPQQCCT